MVPCEPTQGRQKDKGCQAGRSLLRQVLGREKPQRQLQKGRASLLSLLRLRKPVPGPANPNKQTPSSEEAMVRQANGMAARLRYRSHRMLLHHPKGTSTGPSSLCYRKHSRKSSSATLHSSPIRNLLLSHSGSIFSNSKMVLALCKRKGA